MRLPSGLNVALWTISCCVEVGYLMAGYSIPKVHFGVPPSSQKVHIVGTEDREGRRVFVGQRGRQNPVDVPEAGGAIV